MTPLLTATELAKDYQARAAMPVPALRNVSLAVQPGDCVTIMGPSGCGKTTLLNCLSGLDSPSSGTVVFDGQELTGLPEKTLAAIRLRRIGFVFQHPAFLPALSLLDNIVLPGFLAGSARAEVVARARRLAAATGIADLVDRNISQVSGGQLQRAAICRALVNNPVIVFGDEPTGALNRTAAAEVLGLLSDANRDGATIMLVTHDVRVAARSRRVLAMADGAIIAEHRFEPLSDSAGLGAREKQLSSWLPGVGL
ncbi:MAG: ABC transporter ATP-binding protein [Propionibacteriaceae bacterium]|jgi:putative ABC transport system ATP-binding protein|nr:ABC transporter ATP-binding protein [Propionibacteriaceae bacterium]